MREEDLTNQLLIRSVLPLPNQDEVKRSSAWGDPRVKWDTASSAPTALAIPAFANAVASPPRDA
jgi:hypothetical protein